jgi:hypothetical protein
MLSNRLIVQRSVMQAMAFVAVLSVSTPALSARANFDGPWSVLIITDSGSCDRAYRYGVQISNGRVSYQGDSGVEIFGRVGPRGEVSVRLRQGDQQAVGTGRLSQESGGGRWSGSSPSQRCAGHWEAQRRDGSF